MQKSKPRRCNTVRIISGTHRTRKVPFPDAPGLRPTADRIRETLFNWLREDIRGARCLDLFAGSGALGFEALSRGASWVEFVDSNADVEAAITDSLAAFDLSNAAAHCESAEQWISRNSADAKVFDIVFLDPPFAENLLPKICTKLAESPLLKAGCRIYIETDAGVENIDVPASWQQLKSKRAGNVKFYLYCAPSKPKE